MIDNHHVGALATTPLDEVRREQSNELRHAGQADTARQFKADRSALVRNPDDFSDRQATTLAATRAGRGKVTRAWAMKEMVTAIFAPGLHRRRRRRAARPGAGPPFALPTGTVDSLGPNDPHTPRRDPRRPTP